MSIRRRAIAERLEEQIALNMLPGKPGHKKAVEISESNSRMGRYLRYRAKRRGLSASAP